MNLTETLQAIRVLLSGDDIAVQMEQRNLIDGSTVVEADSFEVGSSIFVVTETENIPLPIGEYQLEDGSVLVVEVEGTIASIEVAVAQTEEQTQTEMSTETVEEEVVETASTETVEEEVVEETISEFVSRSDFDTEIQTIRSEFDSFKESLKLTKETLAEKETEIETLKVELSKQPASTKINHSPEGKQTKQLFKNGKKGKNTFETILNRI